MLSNFLCEKFRGAAPSPVALGYTRGIHPAVIAKAEYILQWDNGQPGDGRKSQINKIIMDA